MNRTSTWEQYYKNTPLFEIPWNVTQADYFIKLLNDNRLGKGKALDLGCGVGKKSIELAKRGFDVTGIDISETAIKNAKINAIQENVNIHFLVADATDLSMLGNIKYNLVLDWANLHGILKSKREKYIEEIAKHVKEKGTLLLRCFGKNSDDPEESFDGGVMGTIYLFSKEDIGRLYNKYFKICEINISKPPKGRSQSHRWFYEFLMSKK